MAVIKISASFPRGMDASDRSVHVYNALLGPCMIEPVI